MTKVLAAEWDSREVRLVSGSVGGPIVVEHALSKDLPIGDASGVVDSSAVSRIIRELAGKAGFASGDIIVAVGRGQVEMRSILMPPADEADLPDMVRFSAMKHFASVGDTWPIDFVSLPKPLRPVSEDSSVQGQEVIAVAISPTVVASVRRVCTEAGFNVKQLGLRPLAAGTLGIVSSKSPIDAKATVLLVDVLADEAEMVVVEQGHVTFMRNVRLPTEADDRHNRLSVGEIRRTLIAAMNVRPGLQVQRIVLWGKNAGGLIPIDEWQKTLDLPVEVVDPLALVECKKSAEHDADTGKFAPLIGMLQQYRMSARVASIAGAVDFLHPRQRPVQETPVLRYVLAATAAGLLLASGLWLYYRSHRELDQQIAELNGKLTGMDATVKAAQKNINDWRRVESFMKGDIQWLDQLAYLSEKSLPADQMIFRDTNISLSPVNNQGKIAARVDIVDQKLEPELEDGLRDDKHQVGSKEIRPGSDRNAIYGWTVDPEILVEPAEVADPLTLPPAKKKELDQSTTENKSEADSDKETEEKVEVPKA